MVGDLVNHMQVYHDRPYVGLSTAEFIKSLVHLRRIKVVREAPERPGVYAASHDPFSHVRSIKESLCPSSLGLATPTLPLLIFAWPAGMQTRMTTIVISFRMTNFKFADWIDMTISVSYLGQE
jgi:hypothetical protein